MWTRDAQGSIPLNGIVIIIAAANRTAVAV